LIQKNEVICLIGKGGRKKKKREAEPERIGRTGR